MDQNNSRRKSQMLRSALSTARRQRMAACTGVVVLALAVPPAFGGPSVTAQLAKVTKLATKADKNATTALKLAKSASAASATGAAGATGPAGPKGDAGAAGAQGPKGDTGAAGATGPKGDTGAAGAQGPKGDKGDTGSQGPVGPAGPSGSSTAYVATDGDGTAQPGNALTDTFDPTVTKILPDAGSYVVIGKVSSENLGVFGASVICELVHLSDATRVVLDSSKDSIPSSGQTATAAFNAAVTVAANDSIAVECKVPPGGYSVDVTRTNLTILPVGAIE